MKPGLTLDAVHRITASDFRNAVGSRLDAARYRDEPTIITRDESGRIVEAAALVPVSVLREMLDGLPNRQYDEAGEPWTCHGNCSQPLPLNDAELESAKDGTLTSETVRMCWQCNPNGERAQ